jgi:hypothetical protein
MQNQLLGLGPQFHDNLDNVMVAQAVEYQDRLAKRTLFLKYTLMLYSVRDITVRVFFQYK